MARRLRLCLGTGYGCRQRSRLGNWRIKSRNKTRTVFLPRKETDGYDSADHWTKDSGIPGRKPRLPRPQDARKAFGRFGPSLARLASVNPDQYGFQADDGNSGS